MEMRSALHDPAREPILSPPPLTLSPSLPPACCALTRCASVFDDRVASSRARAGYVAFAVDVYGRGIRPTNESAAEAAMDKVLSNLTSFHHRLLRGVELLTSMKEGPPVNKSGLAANGYCFGGVMVLELARLGVEGLVGVSSFHGELANLTAQSNDAVNAAVQVHHADLDFQGPTALLGFEDEMRSRNVSVWSTTKYGNCAHGWTDPTGTAYVDLYTCTPAHLHTCTPPTCTPPTPHVNPHPTGMACSCARGQRVGCSRETPHTPHQNQPQKSGGACGAGAGAGGAGGCGERLRSSWLCMLTWLDCQPNR